jgi:hypothetical protein
MIEVHFYMQSLNVLWHSCTFSAVHAFHPLGPMGHGVAFEEGKEGWLWCSVKG